MVRIPPRSNIPPNLRYSAIFCDAAADGFGMTSHWSATLRRFGSDGMKAAATNAPDVRTRHRSIDVAASHCEQLSAPLPEPVYLFLISHGMLFAYERPLCAPKAVAQEGPCGGDSMAIPKRKRRLGKEPPLLFSFIFRRRLRAICSGYVRSNLSRGVCRGRMTRFNVSQARR
jgi:hypothetical protein